MPIKGARETTLAYLAGFFDGEGTVALTPHRSAKGARLLIDRNLYRHLQISVSQKIRPPLIRFAEVFGGYVSKDGENWKWYATTKIAARALEAMLPYLSVKKSRALAGLRWQKTMRRGQRWRPLTEIELQERIDCLKAMGGKYAA